ncbi:MAG: DUF2752 domain-containing protein [Planctomycetaceae bacterium]
MLAGAVLLACPLAIAAHLRPATAGLGTHQQLGLPPCTARSLWGVRCPACGMTTSWSHLVRGEVRRSLQANAGGTALGLVTFSVITALVGHAATARVPRRGWYVWLAWSLVVALVLAVSDWVWRMASG